MGRKLQMSSVPNRNLKALCGSHPYMKLELPYEIGVQYFVDKFIREYFVNHRGI